ncbi:MAG: hypothetical protein HRT44_05755 [Bdellovibrionales bacterium]|nr:hypothetical protein [Bdellovibrionales bacterium]NQZ18749.1 hypothetical protein [Bdellovibrionales bacterium]
MRASLVILLMGFFSLTISCAHQEQKAEIKETKQTAVAKTEVKKETKNRSYSCLVGKDERHVSLDRQSKRCEVHYTKDGERLQVAWAESTQDICDRAFNSIRSNIEGNGFKCNDGDKLIKEEKKAETKKVETAQNTTEKK